MALLMLLVITLYHLCDYLRGPMSNPYYITLHISLDKIALVRGLIGTPATVVGTIVSGLLSLRIGAKANLLLWAVLQPLAVAAFALLAAHGGDYTLLTLGGFRLWAFQTVMAFDSFTMAAAGIALIAFMSSLTSLGYTATQYALLTSAMAWSGKILKGFSGQMVESTPERAACRALLQAYRELLPVIRRGRDSGGPCLRLSAGVAGEARASTVRQPRAFLVGGEDAGGQDPRA